MEFDIDAIRAAGYDVTTPVIISNTDQYAKVEKSASGDVTTSEKVITIQ